MSVLTGILLAEQVDRWSQCVLLSFYPKATIQQPWVSTVRSCPRTCTLASTSPSSRPSPAFFLLPASREPLKLHRGGDPGLLDPPQLIVPFGCLFLDPLLHILPDHPEIRWYGLHLDAGGGLDEAQLLADVVHDVLQPLGRVLVLPGLAED